MPEYKIMMFREVTIRESVRVVVDAETKDKAFAKAYTRINADSNADLPLNVDLVKTEIGRDTELWDVRRTPNHPPERWEGDFIYVDLNE